MVTIVTLMAFSGINVHLQNEKVNDKTDGIANYSNLIKIADTRNFKGSSSRIEANLQNQNVVENSIATLYLNWLKSNNKSSVSITSFKIFISQDHAAQMYLRILTSLEQSNYLSNENVKFSIPTMEKVVSFGKPVQYVNTSVDTTQGLFYDYSVLYKVNLNGTPYEVWKVNVTTPTGNFIDPWVWVNINYYVYHAPWYLGGWSLTYGENDNCNVEFLGSEALSFFNTWENITTDTGYGLAAAGLVALFIPMPVLAQAIGAALIVAGVGFEYESSTMLNYYESNGFSYIHLDLVNEYFYPWVTVLGSLASSIGLYGLDWGGGSYTFWYNIPFVAYGGMLGVAFSADISSVTQQFLNDYGNGNWVWFS